MLKGLLIAFVICLGLTSSACAQGRAQGPEWQHDVSASAALSQIAIIFVLGDITTNEMQPHLAIRGARHGTLPEMVAFLEAYGQGLGNLRFVALGSTTEVDGIPMVAMIHVRPGSRPEVTLVRRDSRWPPMTMFVVVTPPQPSEVI